MNSGKDYLSVSEVMEKLGVSRVTVSRWLTSGKMRGEQHEITSQWRIHAEEVERFQQAWKPNYDTN